MQAQILKKIEQGLIMIGFSVNHNQGSLIISRYGLNVNIPITGNVLHFSKDVGEIYLKIDTTLTSYNIEFCRYNNLGETYAFNLSEETPTNLEDEENTTVIITSEVKDAKGNKYKAYYRCSPTSLKVSYEIDSITRMHSQTLTLDDELTEIIYASQQDNHDKINYLRFIDKLEVLDSHLEIKCIDNGVCNYEGNYEFDPGQSQNMVSHLLGQKEIFSSLNIALIILRNSLFPKTLRNFIEKTPSCKMKSAKPILVDDRDDDTVALCNSFFEKLMRGFPRNIKEEPQKMLKIGIIPSLKK